MALSIREFQIFVFDLFLFERVGKHAGPEFLHWWNGDDEQTRGRAAKGAQDLFPGASEQTVFHHRIVTAGSNGDGDAVHGFHHSKRFRLRKRGGRRSVVTCYHLPLPCDRSQPKPISSSWA